MIKRIRAFFLVVLSSLSAACFQVQLTGSVGDAELTVSPLRQPGTVLESTRTLTPDDLLEQWGQALWDKLAPQVRQVSVGIARLEPEGLDPDAVYRLIEPHLKDWDDDAIRLRLEAASHLLVTDVDGSGAVNYDDVLRWNLSLDGDAYLGEHSDLHTLAEAITAGQPVDMLSDLAAGVLGNHVVVLAFDRGEVTVETYNWESPITAANFLAYVRDGFYDQMLVHRAIDSFMIQMGLVEYLGANEGGSIQWALKTAGDPILNESDNGLSNTRATLSMARTSDPHSASSQFFINQADNRFLDFGSSNSPDGYAVFARVISGMDVVDAIAGERTGRVSGIGSDVPLSGVLLEAAALQ